MMSLKSYHYAAVLFTIVCAVFMRSTGFDFVNLDDVDLLVGNPLIHTFSPRIWLSYDPELYIPLTLLSFQLEYLFVGLSPWLYHGTNVVLHGLNTVLVFFLSLHVLTLHACPEHGRRVARSKAESQDQIPSKLFPAFLCSLLFALHPIQVEAVAWVSARKDLLSTLFFLLSLLSYCNSLHVVRGTSNVQRANVQPFGHAQDRRVTFWYVFSLLTFLLALLSKVTVVTLPAILLLIHFYQGTLSKQTAKRTIPFFGLSILFMIIAVFGKTQNLVSLTIWDYILLSSKGIFFYVWKILWPADLAVFYVQTTPVTIASAEFLLSFLGMLVALLLLVFLLRRYKIPFDGAQDRQDTRYNSILGVVVFGIFFFLITLSPSLLTVSRAGEIMIASDRYVYIPLIGLIAIICGLCCRSDRRAWRAMPLLGVIGVVCVCTALSYQRLSVWRTSGTLFGDVLRTYPQSSVAQNNYGLYLMEQGSMEDALTHLRNAIERNPEYPDALTNLGVWYGKSGDFDRAETYLQKAISIQDDHAQAYFNLGGVYQMTGQTQKAIETYEHVLELEPHHWDAEVQLQKLIVQSS